MKILSLFLVLLLSTAAIAPDCIHDDGDCIVAATYYPETDRTVWSAACDDTYTGGGMIGGNLALEICGA